MPWQLAEAAALGIALCPMSDADLPFFGKRQCSHSMASAKIGPKARQGMRCFSGLARS
jgi:hypothetical protein